MPFSNRTKRQRCENGQVVPEYKTIMVHWLQKIIKAVAAATLAAVPLPSNEHDALAAGYLTSFQ
jgi:hypothetical protein